MVLTCKMYLHIPCLGPWRKYFLLMKCAGEKLKRNLKSAVRTAEKVAGMWQQSVSARCMPIHNSCNLLFIRQVTCFRTAKKHLWQLLSVTSPILETMQTNFWLVASVRVHNWNCYFTDVLFLLDRMFRLRFLPIAAGLSAVLRRYHGTAHYPRTRRRLVVAAFIGTTAATASASFLWQR